MKRTVLVSMEVDVTVDETTFTPEFMAEFQAYFFDFDTIEDHICHIAQLEAREVLNRNFTEGYGPLSKMGIEAEVVPYSLATEIQKAEQ